MGPDLMLAPGARNAAEQRGALVAANHFAAGERRRSRRIHARLHLDPAAAHDEGQIHVEAIIPR